MIKLPKPEQYPDAGDLYGTLAEYQSTTDLVNVAAKVRETGIEKWDCYSPFPVHGIDPAMGIKMTVLPLIVFCIGLSGLAGGILLQWWTNAFDWAWIVSGKPFWSWPANAAIAFETTILASVFASFFGMWTLNGLPQVFSPWFRKDQFRKVTDDSFFIGIQASDENYDKAKAVLESSGAVSIDSVHMDADPGKKKMPFGVYAFILVSSVVALLPFALIADARASKSDKPHFHVIPDMDFQDRGNTQAASEFFPDGRTSRAPVLGTVAQGQLNADEHLNQGLTAGQWATTFPAAVTVDDNLFKRGKVVYEKYCQPCHGLDGKGMGIVAQKALSMPASDIGKWAPPANLLDQRIQNQPVGQIFNTISYGRNTMLGYAPRIKPVDRWAIIAHLRTLQERQK